MELIDWIILVSTLLLIVVYGTIKTRGAKSSLDYIKAGNQAKWWTIGLSVMATQASAITFLSTPGQAFHDGMGFIQFYFGVPLAIIIVCVVFIPIYHKLKVYTAYEYLEKRFDLKTRTLTALLFLIQRSLSAGITIFAPAIILSSVLGWDLTTLNIILGLLVIIYTVSGGTKAVNYTQKYQMGIIFVGLLICLVVIINLLPENISFRNAIDIAGANSKLEILNFSFDLENRYTIWSGLIGGTFLMMSYFGTDQSQVQRYLSGKSLKEMQLGMIFNGILKIPMQFFILFIGVMVFVFYQFNSSPINFNPQSINTVNNSTYEKDYKNLQNELNIIFNEKQNHISNLLISKNDNVTNNRLSELELKEKKLRLEAKNLIALASEEKNIKVETNDKDYVFITFILENLPKGLIGLLLAVILSAAMSSTSSEINALATTTAIDIYKRNKKNVTDDQLVKSTKFFTFLWGIIAIGIACVAYLADNLIQLVNIIGSIFYGNILGIFLIAFFFKFIKSNAVFFAAIITQIIIIYGWYNDWMPFLWLNLFGCIVVITISSLLQLAQKN
ncbi:MAG: sodium/solute symporter [Flavobacteriaceae bacterium]|jgi:solute:Na+ symporter, SSS family|nr:sodium/solute symporter [Flavobacteriaceae bacterium]MBT4113144.1 sodium/solute symporter [Flavobacteriaceae bacterium]MBT4614195.1 sodium/solute symporter [Flavobacteriaceae bacterium]MBT5246447.1 sodium/solute symporter [Flavobacteriaceae bacterium]MBT5650791.1 sodium/solute symporter [Flavobacteriaceae bacterium]